MNGRRVIVGLCMLCALIVSALAAQGASAATTAFTCTEDAETLEWSDEHCKTAVGAANHATQGVYGHATFAQDTTTTITGGPGTSFSGVQKLKATVNGITTELTTNGGLGGSGWMENKEEGGEMVAKGEGTITYTNVKVAKPEGKGCKVYTDNGAKGEEGVVHTEPLKAKTTNGMGLKFEPKEGTVFARFFLEGCTGSAALEGLNGTYTVTGTVTGEPSGAETKFTHTATTAEETLFLKGVNKAGIEGALTLEGEDPEDDEDEYNALTATTPEKYV